MVSITSLRFYPAYESEVASVVSDDNGETGVVGAQFFYELSDVHRGKLSRLIGIFAVSDGVNL